MTVAGGGAWLVRAFEARRPGPTASGWISCGAIARGRPRERLPADLGMLLPDAGARASSGDRSRLFAAVVEFLRDSDHGTAVGSHPG